MSGKQRVNNNNNKKKTAKKDEVNRKRIVEAKNESMILNKE